MLFVVLQPFISRTSQFMSHAIPIGISPQKVQRLKPKPN